MISGQPTRDELLFLDIDSRLVWIWTEAWQIDEWDDHRLAAFLRFSYYLGYHDALTEERRGTLYRIIVSLYREGEGACDHR
jgi:hypothetical protein